MSNDQDNFAALFEARQIRFVNALRGAVSDHPSPDCRLVDGAFTFGWMFEQGGSGHPQRTEGGVEYAVNYLRHMTGQGFYTAFAVCGGGPPRVWLKTWEEPDEEPEWPSEGDIVLICNWCPMMAGEE